MGFCVNGSDCYDAFLSYASVDDVVHGGWVGDFERYLKKMVVAELKRADQVANADAEMFSVCRDKTGFPEGGDLHEVIDEKVRQSQFLFIFLGKGYLKSGYCLSELDIFREKAGGTAEQALKRTYVIVLDRDALKSLQERQPEGMPDSRRPLWNKLSEFTQKGIRKEDFLLEDGLLPVYEREDRPDGEFHKRCTSLVQKFTKKLIDHRNTLRPQPPSLLIRPTVKALAIGAVPERLKMARDQLVGALAGVPVAVVEDDIRKPTDEIRERLKHAQVLVQPFDDFEVLYERRDPPGGHLAVQKALFEQCHKDELPTTATSILWWKPLTKELGEPSGTGWKPIDEDDLKFLDGIPQEQKRHCTAQALAAELLQRESDPSVIAKVWVEWEESDRNKIREAKDIVRKCFCEVWERKKEQYGIECKADLCFGDADWANLEDRLAEKPDGVVIVYNNKKEKKVLRLQEEAISNLPEVLVKKMFPGMFYMRDNGIYHPFNWSVIRFWARDHELGYDTDELTEFVGNLVDILYHKYLASSCGIALKQQEAVS